MVGYLLIAHFQRVVTFLDWKVSDFVQVRIRISFPIFVFEHTIICISILTLSSECGASIRYSYKGLAVNVV